MVKLIASDVDGTLIQDSTPDLYPEMTAAIKELAKKGILFCAASGRQYQSLQNVFRDVADEIAYIAENGAQIRYQNKNISVTPMKREDVVDIMTMLRPYYGECETIVSTPNGSLMESENKEFLDLITYGYHNTFRRVKDVLAEEDEIIKIAVYRKGSIRQLGESLLIPACRERVRSAWPEMSGWILWIFPLIKGMPLRFWRIIWASVRNRLWLLGIITMISA